MHRPRALETILYGGCIAATLDLIDACAFWAVTQGVSPVVILHSIASGLLGKAAFSGGLATAALGGLLHFLIACGMAAVYYLASLRLPVLIQRPVFYGIVYGVICLLVMDHVVVPLSNAAPSPFRPAWFVDDLLSHAFLVGLPIALIARWSARRIRPV